MHRVLFLAVALLTAPAEAPKSKPFDLLCLASNIYFEAGNQAWKGKLAVKDVTKNRGGEVCKTVFARKQFSWTHQQDWKKIESFLLDSVELSKLEQRAWEDSKEAAVSEEKALSEEYRYFHTADIKPYWSGSGIVIGKHKFLKGKR